MQHNLLIFYYLLIRLHICVRSSLDIAVVNSVDNHTPYLLPIQIPIKVNIVSSYYSFYRGPHYMIHHLITTTVFALLKFSVIFSICSLSWAPITDMNTIYGLLFSLLVCAVYSAPLSNTEKSNRWEFIAWLFSLVILINQKTFHTSGTQINSLHN